MFDIQDIVHLDIQGQDVDVTKLKMSTNEEWWHVGFSLNNLSLDF